MENSMTVISFVAQEIRHLNEMLGTSLISAIPPLARARSSVIPQELPFRASTGCQCILPSWS